MTFTTKEWAEASVRRLGFKVICSFQEGSTTVVRYVGKKGEEKTVEITPSVNEALTLENLKRKLHP